MAAAALATLPHPPPVGDYVIEGRHDRLFQELISAASEEDSGAVPYDPEQPRRSKRIKKADRKVPAPKPAQQYQYDLSRKGNKAPSESALLALNSSIV